MTQAIIPPDQFLITLKNDPIQMLTDQEQPIIQIINPHATGDYDSVKLQFLKQILIQALQTTLESPQTK